MVFQGKRNKLQTWPAFLQQHLRHMAAARLTSWRWNMLKSHPNFKCWILLKIAATLAILIPFVRTIPLRPPSQNHQVFINFRGAELRYNFISHLTNALKNEGIKFFIDNDMQPGKDLNNLYGKIDESRISLVVFSPRYTESRWCMNELLHINRRSNEGKHYVIPVYYKVRPNHVKKLTCKSEFGINFWRFAQESDERIDPIQEYRKAFACTSNKLGLTLREKSPEADFIKEIVETLKKVNKEIGLEEEKKRSPIRALKFLR